MTQSSIVEPSSPDAARSARLLRIRRVSKLMAWACLGTALLLTAAMFVYWTSTPSETLFRHAGLTIAPPNLIGTSVRVGGFALSMVPLGALIYGLLRIRRSFEMFALGQAFSLEAIGGLRAFALAVAASSLLKPIVGAALSLLLGTTSPGHTRSLVLTFGSDTLLALLFAGTVAVIAWVLVEATDIADENRQFV